VEKETKRSTERDAGTINNKCSDKSPLHSIDQLPSHVFKTTSRRESSADCRVTIQAYLKLNLTAAKPFAAYFTATAEGN